MYDVTDFLESHPGGPELVLEYGGKDITEILKDEASHVHSEAAEEILEESLVGFLATEKVMNSAVKSTNPTEILPLPPTAEGKVELKGNGVYERTGLASAEDLSKVGLSPRR